MSTKTKIIIGVGAAAVVIALVVMLVFVFSGDVETPPVDVGLTGTWKVTTHFNAGSGSLAENEYMVFTADTASVYRGDSKTPYATSSYTVDLSTMLLELPDISRKYTIEKKTDEHIRLYESQSSYMYLIRYPNADMSPVQVDTSIVTGHWDITYRDTDKPTKEALVFQDGKMEIYRDGSTEPAGSFDYSWNGTRLNVSALGKVMELNIISSDVVALLETDTGFIWQLKKAN